MKIVESEFYNEVGFCKANSLILQIKKLKWKFKKGHSLN